jgi:SAM-dependent methyltransferase
VRRVTRYDAIGVGYARLRREDPELAARIHEALGDAETVVNVGAGAGSYEPVDRHVIAIEPSDVMAAQRAPERPPAIRAHADSLPLRDENVDAAMSVLSVHHWDEGQERGVRELRRVARGPVVILTFDARVSRNMWLVADYVPEIGELDRDTFPDPELLADWLGGDTTISVVPISRDTPDWTFGAFWAHPERVLDAEARATTSNFARMPDHVVERVELAVRDDLASGLWDARHGYLRELDEYDAGMRLVVSNRPQP